MSDRKRDQAEQAGPPVPPGREERPYPHGTGDRNAWSPTREDPMPVHEGGTQRKAPPGRGKGGATEATAACRRCST